MVYTWLKNGVRIIIIVVYCFFILANSAQAVVDTDNDGLSDEREAYFYTDPNNPDTDGDGYLDGEEIDQGFSPHAGNGAKIGDFDYDGDGLHDWLEMWFGSDIGKEDTDGDGFTDFHEVMAGYDPIDPAPLRKFARRIEVNRAYQRVYYFVDKVKILNLPASTGNPGSETPSGEFIIEKMIPEKRYIGPGYDLAGVVWNMQFKPMFYLHGAYWHNDFGVKTHSHGCVNLRDEDAELLYKYMEIGVPVMVTGTTPKGYYVGS